MAGEIPDQRETPVEKSPTITVTFGGINSAECSITVDSVSPAQIWAAVKMLEHFADDLYHVQMAAEARPTKPNLMVAPAGILDHLPKRNHRRD